MREITLPSCGAKKFIKAANSKGTMEINNIQYRLIISKLMTFLFLRRSLERFVEKSETAIIFHRIKRRGQEEGRKQEIEERQVQREHSTINVKYPLWNIPVAYSTTAEDEYKTGLYRSKFSALGPPLIPFLLPNKHPHMAFCCTCSMFTKLLSARSIILITMDGDGDEESLREDRIDGRWKSREIGRARSSSGNREVGGKAMRFWVCFA